jgi:branched-chain amino acid transport system ATP-binding protein
VAVLSPPRATSRQPLTSALKERGAKLADDQPILEFTDVVLRFEGVTAVDHISFEVAPSELFAIIGPNGAGKTSIFNCISGVYRPQGGTIRFAGRRIDGRRPHEIAALGMARTFQNIELFQNLTVLDNLMLGRHQHMGYGPIAAMLYAGKAHRRETQHREVVERVIDFLEIEDARKLPVALLPYGIQKRVELGRALAMAPRLLLLDEPVAGMNLEEREDMARFILDIKEELDIAIILVDHDMGLVMDIAQRVLAMDFGEAIAMDTPDRIQANPDVIRAYLGEQHDVAPAVGQEAAPHRSPTGSGESR